MTDIDLSELDSELGKDLEILVQPKVSALKDESDRLERNLKSLDLTAIIEYTRKVNEIAKGMNPMLAPMYLRDFIMAYDATNMILMKAVQYDGKAKALLETAKSIAYMDNAAEYMRERNIKDSSAARERYVPIDPDVLRLTDLKTQSEAMVMFLKNKLIVFRCSHDDTKKMAYADNNETPFEGM